MSAIVVQICRADDENKLQQLIGAAMHYWGKLGFTKVNVTYESGTDAQAGVYTLTEPNKAPKKLAVDTESDQTAVLVLSKA
jgi:hypothetical protein